MKRIALIVLMSALAFNAAAHSRMDSTTPENGATLTEAPQEIGLDFAKDIRLTLVELTHADDPGVALDLGEQKSFGRSFAVPLPALGTGVYTIEWRGLGIDGHAMQGHFEFTVN